MERLLATLVKIARRANTVTSIMANAVSVKNKIDMKKLAASSFLLIVCFAIFFRLFCGIFVIQPIGAIPDGATIIYWRTGVNLPFIASADGVLDESGVGVSLLGRGVLLAKLAKPIKEKQIISLDYSETLYLWSTDGKTFEK